MGQRGRLKINVVQHKMTKRKIKTTSQGEINELYIPDIIILSFKGETKKKKRRALWKNRPGISYVSSFLRAYKNEVK